MSPQTIINKVWNFANLLRDDGMSYGDYLEQMTYLLFLKMADEYSQPPYNRDVKVPENFNWQKLKNLTGADLEKQYILTLNELSKQKNILGDIFSKSQNKIQDPAKLSKMVNMIDAEKWTLMGADVKGDIYEGILERNAEDTKSGAGQYFTPRPLIKVIVECIKPEAKKTIADPACGTGGFFLASYDYLLSKELNKEEKEFLKKETFFGNEIVSSTRRLALMNLFLHNIGEIDGEAMISGQDALITEPSKKVDYVLANPPFGKKSSMTFTNESGVDDKDELTYNREDFWTTTSNKQLNFVQHIYSMLKSDGKAAVVLPDNVLFEGGAGEVIRKKLLEKTNLHTILRLPTGIFYANGVKANVLFFDNKITKKDPWTKEIWFYDYRTNIHHTKKKNPMKSEDLEDFIKCYKPDDITDRIETWSEENSEGRWKKYSYEEIISRDKTSLDIFWLKDKSLTNLEDLPDPDVLASEIIENLEAGLESFRSVLNSLEK
jgi:type I restriction enzyme M protein